eukprot:TRINITY_DN35235_c0_g1_i1.p4 TRINITY_DN35235_c0_g1~~TRINITY_DN35235_c0_g1_i1.p4  ORF type:complete len:267 (+),score=56.85 TRINITY_DN35235_c0_g1_i1:301-1101(+)
MRLLADGSSPPAPPATSGPSGYARATYGGATRADACTEPLGCSPWSRFNPGVAATLIRSQRLPTAAEAVGQSAPEVLRAFVARCLQGDPAQRATAVELLQEPLVATPQPQGCAASAAAPGPPPPHAGPPAGDSAAQLAAAVASAAEQALAEAPPQQRAALIGALSAALQRHGAPFARELVEAVLREHAAAPAALQRPRSTGRQTRARRAGRTPAPPSPAPPQMQWLRTKFCCTTAELAGGRLGGAWPRSAQRPAQPPRGAAAPPPH